MLTKLRPTLFIVRVQGVHSFGFPEYHDKYTDFIPGESQKAIDWGMKRIPLKKKMPK